MFRKHILFNITNSNPKQTYGRIQEIAENDNALDFLDKEISFLNHKMTVSHFIFYFGLFSKDKILSDMFNAMSESLMQLNMESKLLHKTSSKEKNIKVIQGSKFPTDYLRYASFKKFH